MKKILLPLLLAVVVSPLSAIYLVDLQKDIIAEAEKFKGTPYVFGGASPKGFDCSGFIYFLFSDFVTDLPRSSKLLGSFGKPVSKEDPQPGDLLFFATGSDPKQISHVALYLGQNSMIQAASAGPHTGIIITDIEEKYWKARLHSARRLAFPAAAELAFGLKGDTYKVEYARGTYKGEMRNGEPEGRGSFDLKTGDTYEGEFKDGFFHGQGTYVWQDKSTYKGGFAKGKFQGKGTITYSSGNKYTGDWKEDKIEGKGIYTWASGARYEGSFVNFQETGGWYTAPDGQKAWAKNDNGSLKFWTDDSMTASAAVTGPRLASARAIGAKNLNNFSKPNSEWDNFVGSDFPEDWEK